MSAFARKTLASARRVAKKALASARRVTRRIEGWVSICLYLMLYSQPAAAVGIDVSNLSAMSMLQNLASQLPYLTRMVTALAYVMGLYFIFFAMLKLKQFGEARTMMSHEHHLGPPLIYLFVGMMLLYIPTAIHIGLSTFWTEPNPYSYVADSDQWSQFYGICFSIVQFIGLIAFIRGLVMLSHLAGHGGHQGALAKGLTHVIAGLFCINIYQFVQTIFGTLLGIQFSL